MKNTESVAQIVKIVYFDEGAATDLLYIVSGGKSSEKEEHIIAKTSELAANAEAQAGHQFRLLSSITAKLGIDGSAEIARESSRILSKAIESTLLTDYLSLVKQEKIDFIHVFTNCKPYPFPESFAYFKMITPYLIMTEGKVPLAEGLNVNLSMIDQALDSGRGYYELISDENGEQIVLRFNSAAFRNNYSLSDLTKMRLTFHAIEVGTIELSDLVMKNEFGTNEKADISGYDIVDENRNSTNTGVKVYDVLLAGVSI